MSHDIRKSKTYEALLNCIVRRIQAERKAILARSATTGPITDAARKDSIDLAAADEALTRLGHFDTR